MNGWFAARPSGTEDIYKIYEESFRGADHLRCILEEAQTIVNDARQIVDWQHSLEQKWALLHFVEVKVETRGAQLAFEVQICLGDLDPKAVRVELYADGMDGGVPVRQAMKLARQPVAASGSYVYSAAVPETRPATDLYGACDTALRRRCDPAGRRTHPVAAMIRSTGKRR